MTKPDWTKPDEPTWEFQGKGKGKTRVWVTDGGGVRLQLVEFSGAAAMETALTPADARSLAQALAYASLVAEGYA